MDSNRPAHWQVIETATMKVVADNLTHDQALSYCTQREPQPDVTGFRYTMQPVRAADVRTGEGWRHPQSYGHQRNDY